MSILSDHAVVWMIAVGTSGAIFGGGSFLLIKSGAGRVDEHKTPQHSEPSSSDEHSAHESHPDSATPHDANHASPHWTYSESANDGPEHWGAIAESFATCEKGTTQSPIDIKNTVLRNDAPTIEFHYSPATVAVENNGHTIVANMPDQDNHITINEEKYTLAQFHFHNPSEHKIKGKAAAMELHFVHKNDKGGLAVIGVMLSEDGTKENSLLQPIWNNFTKKDHAGEHGGPTIDLPKLLPKSRDFFHYAGSLTTPPCSEGVRWFVMKDSVAVSHAQVTAYTKTFGGPTNRPVQPAHKREIIEGSGAPVAH